MPRLRRMTARQIESVLRRHGFAFVSQKGSHRKWRHPARGLQVVVPEHAGRVLPIGTQRAIMAGSEIPEHEWRAQKETNP